MSLFQGGSVHRFASGAARRWVPGLPIAALVALALATSGAPGALAQGRADGDGSSFGAGLEPFAADGPLTAVISLASQQIRVFDRNGLVTSSKVSTGRNGYETPEGIFTIIERKVEHRSNLYDDAEMPFMQRITWSGVALHQGVVPGYRASHGCIRLPNGFAERLYRTSRMGTRVVIVSHEAVPESITHRVLPQRGLLPAPAELPMSRAPAGPGFGDRMGLGVPTSAATLEPASLTEAPAKPGLTVSELRRQRAAVEARVAALTKDLRAANAAVRPRNSEKARADRALQQAVAATRAAEDRAAAAAKAVARAPNERAMNLAVAGHVNALVELARVKGRETQAHETAAARTSVANELRARIASLESERTAAIAEVRDLSRRLFPVTLFVSRQTGRIVVRQASQQVMELPITIRDPRAPIGTHVFTAVEAGDGSGRLRWVGLTVETELGDAPVPPPPKPVKAKQSKGRKAVAAVEPTPAPPSPPVDALRSARKALDRIEIPEAIVAEFAPGLLPGSTVIISDLGPSIETGPGTDIVVQTKGEEQAKQNIANWVAKKRAEARQTASMDSPRRRSSSAIRTGDWNRW